MGIISCGACKAAKTHEVIEIVSTAFGQKYVVEGQLEAAGGRKPKVRAVWFIAKGGEVATLVTAYPLQD